MASIISSSNASFVPLGISYIASQSSMDWCTHFFTEYRDEKQYHIISIQSLYCFAKLGGDCPQRLAQLLLVTSVGDFLHIILFDEGQDCINWFSFTVRSIVIYYSVNLVSDGHTSFSSIRQGVPTWWFIVQRKYPSTYSRWQVLSFGVFFIIPS